MTLACPPSGKGAQGMLEQHDGALAALEAGGHAVQSLQMLGKHLRHRTSPASKMNHAEIEASLQDRGWKCRRPDMPNNQWRQVGGAWQCQWHDAEIKRSSCNPPAGRLLFNFRCLCPVAAWPVTLSGTARRASKLASLLAVPALQ